MTAQEILFRCSGLGNLMTEPKGKTPKEQYNELIINRNKWQNDYSLIANKNTKTAQHRLRQIQEANNKILRLQRHKDQVYLSDTCVSQILKTYASQVYKRAEIVKSKFFFKGSHREEDAITVISRNTNTMFEKNDIRLNNEYVTGEPDLFIGEEIIKAKETLDAKCSWSYNTFLDSKFRELSHVYKWQGHGYMWLTGAERHTVCYCLVNGTQSAINDEIRKLSWRMGVLDASVEQDPKFIEEARQIERNHIFDINAFCLENPGHEFFSDVDFDGKKFSWPYDIPVEERMHTFVVERSEACISEAKERIIECRAWVRENVFKTNGKNSIQKISY